MSGTTWSKFFWSDWDTDPALRLCSFAAQGFWMRLLCIAASHDPIGYVAVEGRALSVTDTARLTGASETEAQTLTAELERNGVFSRDRTGRIYSRRMTKDARVSAEARKNGKLGGNPGLGKHRGKSQGVNPTLKPGVKPQEPSASTKVRTPNSVLTLSEAKHEFLGPKEVRAAFLAELGEEWTVSYLDPCAWQDVPERALVPATRLAGSKIIRDARKVLSSLSLLVLEKAA